MFYISSFNVCLLDYDQYIRQCATCDFTHSLPHLVPQVLDLDLTICTLFLFGSFFCFDLNMLSFIINNML